MCMNFFMQVQILHRTGMIIYNITHGVAHCRTDTKIKQKKQDVPI